MEHLQLDLFSVSTSKEIKNLRRWVKRLEKRISEMEMRQELIDHAKKTGFKYDCEVHPEFDFFKGEVSYA